MFRPDNVVKWLRESKNRVTADTQEIVRRGVWRNLPLLTFIDI